MGARTYFPDSVGAGIPPVVRREREGPIVRLTICFVNSKPQHIAPTF